MFFCFRPFPAPVLPSSEKGSRVPFWSGHSVEDRGPGLAAAGGAEEPLRAGLLRGAVMAEWAATSKLPFCFCFFRPVGFKMNRSLLERFVLFFARHRHCYDSLDNNGLLRLAWTRMAILKSQKEASVQRSIWLPLPP